MIVIKTVQLSKKKCGEIYDSNDLGKLSCQATVYQ